MHIYLPIAEMSANVLLLLGMGGAVGFLSGLFGVGGGFLLTPLLIFSGIPSAVAVGTGAAQIVASSVSGAVAQYRRNNVDIKMGVVLLAGGVVGSVIGVKMVRILRLAGQFDLFVALAYVTFLGVIGVLMLIESINAIQRARSGNPRAFRQSGQHSWIHKLPFKMRFHRSKLYISAIPPMMIGAFVGFLGAIMGAGGGFIMVPAMIYLLRVPTNVVVGTSLFQIVFVSAVTTVMQSSENFSVDIVLALLLIVSGVIGAQFGAAAGARLKGEQLRLLLAALVLLVCGRIAWDLVIKPPDLFSISKALGGP
ncbi:sulfite exporter TauE/SafE family protein [Hyphomicrobium sp.]|uniref:sulfite exporter TauE/SafE family protein n=1 Tax=Hyphomicrobium sp. TaxID=82 RepID=UPI002E36E636|nr:sulfite exporter TauE/SafE family protein [Hyphomicrobium sp.]HEX2839768.1 sulfite exporter TauE/SafE family protein [Hyphomicrobium sp.]